MPADTGGVFAPKRIFREVKWEVLKVVFLNEFLNAAIVFFLLSVVLTFFNMSFFYSLGAAVLVLVWRVPRGWRESVIRDLERGNPEVNEILRTAYEYQSERSVMVQGLLFDLQRRMPTVSAGVLLDGRRIIAKTVILGLLAFTPIFVISVTPQLIQQNPFRNVDVGALFRDDPAEAIGQLMGVTLNESDDIYGAANVAELGDQQLDIEIVPGGQQVSFEKVSDPDDKSFKYNDYPVDAEAQDAESSQGAGYDASDVDLINTYSCKARGDC